MWNNCVIITSWSGKVEVIYIMLYLLCILKVDTEIYRSFEDMRLTSLAVKVFMGLGNDEVIYKYFPCI